MSTAKRYLVIALSFALALTIFAAFTPRIAHAITATLVQVVNTAANPVMTRSVDEPARVPYFVSGQPSCPFLNECFLTGTAVPAGKRLRVTRIQGALLSQSSVVANTTFAALQPQGDQFNKYVIFPITPFNAAFYGTSLGFAFETDVYFEAGQTPEIQIGTSFTGNFDSGLGTRLTIVGYLVDVAP